MNRTVFIPQNQVIYSQAHNPQYQRNQRFHQPQMSIRQNVSYIQPQRIMTAQPGIQMRQQPQSQIRVQQQRLQQQTRYVLINEPQTPIVRVPQNQVIFRSNVQANSSHIQQVDMKEVIEKKNSQKNSNQNSLRNSRKISQKNEE